MENRIHNELVSIIMPVYNVEKYIRQSIESVINQTYKDWELLIMDDCSKDSSYQIMEEYAAKDERIKIQRAEKNKGVVKVRNSLTQMANGRYIAFLDSDDLWMVVVFAVFLLYVVAILVVNLSTFASEGRISGSGRRCSYR